MVSDFGCKAVCAALFPTRCRLCSEQCKFERQECQSQLCPTCDEDPDGLECLECSEPCFAGELQCNEERCRPICPDEDACRLCSDQCKFERQECQSQCPTCDEDPDGLECMDCSEPCFAGELECAEVRCRPICEPNGRSSAFRRTNLTRGLRRNGGSYAVRPTGPQSMVRGRFLNRNAFNPTTDRGWF